MAHDLEQLDPAALDLIEASTECRLALARAAIDAAGSAPAPAGRAPDPARRAPLRMSFTIRESTPPDFDGCVPTDREIAAWKRRQCRA